MWGEKNNKTCYLTWCFLLHVFLLPGLVQLILRPQLCLWGMSYSKHTRRTPGSENHTRSGSQEKNKEREEEPKEVFSSYFCFHQHSHRKRFHPIIDSQALISTRLSSLLVAPGQVLQPPESVDLEIYFQWLGQDRLSRAISVLMQPRPCFQPLLLSPPEVERSFLTVRCP